MEDKIDYSITRNFIKPENLEKLHKEYFKEYSGTEKDPEVLRIELSSSIDCQDVDEGCILLGISNEMGYFSVSYKPTQEEILSLVEQQEALQGGLLVKVVELVVKKLNKFKALIESIKGV